MLTNYDMKARRLSDAAHAAIAAAAAAAGDAYYAAAAAARTHADVSAGSEDNAAATYAAAAMMWRSAAKWASTAAVLNERDQDMWSRNADQAMLQAMSCRDRIAALASAGATEAENFRLMVSSWISADIAEERRR